ncbi:uncharacterized protein [Argopecten irradians]|uniref:uncharacterized protein isoform X2 n=1 Tax=Argopecten irradians TaxID=31199 RepID=UPI003713F3B2
MGNEYSCDIHDTHRNLEARNACIRIRKTEEEIQQMRLKYCRTYPCTLGHSHNSLNDANDCSNKSFDHEMEKIRMNKAYTCNANHKHSGLGEVHACHDMQKARDEAEIRKRKTYTCSVGHSHSSFDEVKDCNETRLKEKYFEFMTTRYKPGYSRGTAGNGYSRPTNNFLALEYKTLGFGLNVHYFLLYGDQIPFPKQPFFSEFEIKRFTLRKVQ